MEPADATAGAQAPPAADGGAIPKCLLLIEFEGFFASRFGAPECHAATSLSRRHRFRGCFSNNAVFFPKLATFPLKATSRQCRVRSSARRGSSVRESTDSRYSIPERSVWKRGSGRERGERGYFYKTARCSEPELTAERRRTLLCGWEERRRALPRSAAAEPAPPTRRRSSHSRAGWHAGAGAACLLTPR